MLLSLLSRHFRRALALLVPVLVFGALAPQARAQYQLVWEDNFDGTTLDANKWEHMIGNGCPNLCGWGNNELQYYREQNATVSGGTLSIRAEQQFFGGAQYTSSRIRTRNLGDWRYGRYEIRAKLPTGQGLWPAIWMLPTDEVHGVWAASGEIDIMEAVGQTPNRVLGTLHYGATFPGNVQSGGSYVLPNGTFHDDFHVFALEWDEFEMRWYVDGILYSTKTSWWTTGGPYPAPFNERFHLLLNLAVGGNLPGPPNASTQFPQTFEIDYVRVYQEQPHNPADCICVFDDMEHADPIGSGYFTFNGPNAGGGIDSNALDLPPGQGGAASLEAGWGNGGAPGFLGGFGQTFRMDLTDATHFDMWIRPDAGQDYTLEINLQDDDDGNEAIAATPDGADDEFQYALRVSPSGPGAISGGGWQRVSIPLTDFVDDNSYHFGGNGVLDPTPTSAGGNGQLINVVFALVSTSGSNVTFRSDLWTFTRRTGSLSGRVWRDENGDGTDLFGNEPGIAGVRVELFNTDLGAVVATVETTPSGGYEFAALTRGTFEVRIDAATLPFGTNPSYDPDGLATPGQTTHTLACDATRLNLDFGYAPMYTGTTYCTPAEANSSGAPGSIAAIGSPSVAASELALLARSLPQNSFGFFIVSSGQTFVPGAGGSQGNLCVGPSIGRGVGDVIFNTGAAGETLVEVDMAALPTPTGYVQIQPGESWYFQGWFRDANPTATSNFTNAACVVFQ